MGNFKILIADNDENFRETLARDVLTPAGYEVLQAGDITQARDILQNELIHLAIIDIRLYDDDDPHDESGLRLVQEIDPGVARIVLSGYPPGGTIESYPAKVRLPIPGGFLMLYLVTKQATPEILLEAVQKALDEDFEIAPEQRIAVLTSGGDSPGMNAAIWGIVRSAMINGTEVIGVQDGFQGLVEDQMYKLSWSSVSNILEQGGTILGTARFKEFHEKTVRSKAVENIIRKRITGVIVIGGDGSMKGAQALAGDLAELGKTLRTAAIPGTIDNDIWGTDMSLGAASAANAMINQLRHMLRPAQALRRIFICEVMGAYSGYLALQSALGIGADAVMIPERLIEVSPPKGARDSSSWKDRIMLAETAEAVLRELKEIALVLEGAFAAGKRYGFVIVAEGVRKLTAEGARGEYIRTILENQIKQWTSLAHPDVRDQIMGYPARGAAPCRFDIWLGARLGMAAVDGILSGDTDLMVGWSENGGIIKTHFDEVVKKSNRAPKEIWNDRPNWQELFEMQCALAHSPKVKTRLSTAQNRFIRF